MYDYIFCVHISYICKYEFGQYYLPHKTSTIIDLLKDSSDNTNHSISIVMGITMYSELTIVSKVKLAYKPICDYFTETGDRMRMFSTGGKALKT